MYQFGRERNIVLMGPFFIFCVCVSFSSVNGNGTVHAAYKSEEAGSASTASLSSLTSVKENKPKASSLPM